MLGIQRGASDDEIKKAYRAKCKRWHPDLNPNDPTAEEHFKEVQAAYDAITKGDTGPQMGGGPYGGAYGSRAATARRLSAGLRATTALMGISETLGLRPLWLRIRLWRQYQQQRGPSYSGADTPEMQAARNFVANGRYAEARRVLDGMTVPHRAVVLSLPRWPIRAWATASMPCRMPAAPPSWSRTTLNTR